MSLRVIGAIALGAATTTCGGDTMSFSIGLRALSEVTPAEWSTLASRQVFFGHQSVGVNMVQGLTEVLTAHPDIHLTVVETKEPAPGPGFYHARVGGNEHPEAKVDEFAAIAMRGLGTAGSVGMVKFCYVDVRPDTDPNALFAMYQQRIAALKAREPGLTIVHFTMPLTTTEDGWTYFKLKVRGYDTDRDRNVVRNRYNALVRAAYVGKEPVFDLAALESRRPDGSLSSFRRWGKEIFTLAPEYTTDGGHLNEGARRMVAEQLLIFLAKLPAPPSSAS